MRPILLLAISQLAISSFNALKQATVTEKTLFITELIRHGSRSPMLSFKNVDWMKQYGKEELTLNGQRMHYVAGKNIALNYPDIFTGILGPEEIWVRSTGYNRTIQSAMGHLYGAFEDFKSTDVPFEKNNEKLQPGTQQRTFDVNNIVFNTALPVNYNPYPVHSPEDKNKDLFLNAQTNYCNKTWDASRIDYDNKFAKVKDSKMLKDPINSAIKDFGLNVPNYPNKINFNDYFKITDFLISDFENSPTPQIDVSKEAGRKMLKDMQRIYSLDLFSYLSYKPSLKNAVTGYTKYVYDTMESLNTKWKSGTQEKGKDPKYTLLSAHDSTIGALLMANGIINVNCLQEAFVSENAEETCEYYPPLASSFVFELVEKTNGASKSQVIRFNYNGTYLDFCHLGSSQKNKKYECTLDQFKKTVTDMTVPDINAACFLPPKDNGDNDIWNKNTLLILFIVTLVMFVLLQIAFIVYCLRVRKMKSKVENGSKLDSETLV